MNNYIPLEINVKYANIFQNVNYFFKIHLYTVASILDDNSPSSSSSSKRTMVDKHSGLNPFWWSRMKFQIEKSKLLNNISPSSIKFCIKCRRILGRDKKIGEVNLPLKDLYYLYSSSASNLDSGGSYKAAFSICSSHLENSRGILYVSFMFGSGDIYGVSELLSAAAVPSAPHVDEWNQPVIDHHYDDDYDSRSVNCCYGSAPYLPEEEVIY